MKTELTAGIEPPAFQPLKLSITIETEAEFYALLALYYANRSVAHTAYSNNMGCKNHFTVKDIEDAISKLYVLNVHAHTHKFTGLHRNARGRP